MTVVVDASVLVSIASDGKLGPAESANAIRIASHGDVAVVCTPLAMSESLAAIRRAAYDDRLTQAAAQTVLRNLEDLPIEQVTGAGLRARALEIAAAMGWARTYDAEHCALAEHVGGRLVTCDLRLRRGADGRLPYVVTPAEILAER